MLAVALGRTSLNYDTARKDSDHLLGLRTLNDIHERKSRTRTDNAT